jgi:hypothetical protein
MMSLRIRDNEILDERNLYNTCSIRGVDFFFFGGEGPRSRRYGRTAALRLLVQPCDEDDDDYFWSFS